jgi:hypothetical protein
MGKLTRTTTPCSIEKIYLQLLPTRKHQKTFYFLIGFGFFGQEFRYSPLSVYM